MFIDYPNGSKDKLLTLIREFSKAADTTSMYKSNDIYMPELRENEILKRYL